MRAEDRKKQYEERAKELGYLSFDDYLTRSVHKNLSQMAKEMKVNDSTFQKFHARYAKEKTGGD